MLPRLLSVLVLLAALSAPASAHADLPLPLVDGDLWGLELERVQSEIREALPPVHRRLVHCWEQGLKRRPVGRGTMIVELTVFPAGKAPNAEVTHIDGDGAFLSHHPTRTCVTRAFRRLRLRRGPTSGPGTFRLTYKFVSD